MRVDDLDRLALAQTDCTPPPRRKGEGFRFTGQFANSIFAIVQPEQSSGHIARSARRKQAAGTTEQTACDRYSSAATACRPRIAKAHLALPGRLAWPACSTAPGRIASGRDETQCRGN